MKLQLTISLPVSAYSSIIIYPVGHIRILLDLRDQDIFADRVDRS